MDNTTNIYEKLISSTNLSSFLNTTTLINKNELFYKTFYSYMDKHNKTPKDIIHSTQLSKSYVYKFLSGERTVSRDNLLQISFALNLSLTETNELLKCSNLSNLYSKDERDCIIIFGLLHHYNLTDIDEILYSYNLTPLKKIL